MQKRLRLLECPDYVAHIPNSSDSDSLSDEDSMPGDNNSPDSQASAHGGNPLVALQATDVADIINYNTKNNYNQVVGLCYFCGGAERHSSDPTKHCTKSAKKFLQDIESRTEDNWDDRGRLELAQKYALGRASTCISTILKDVGLDWKEFKKRFLQLYSEELTYQELQAELSQARRQRGENLTDFYIRLDDLEHKAKSEKPTYADCLSEMKVNTFLTALPPAFKLYITDVDKADPPKILIKARQYVKAHPECRLTNADIEKEIRQGVQSVNLLHAQAHAPQKLTKPGHPPSQTLATNNWNKPGKWVRNDTYEKSQIECFRCGRKGHIARHCYTNIHNNPNRRKKCDNCGMNNHPTFLCRKPPKLEEKKNVNNA